VGVGGLSSARSKVGDDGSHVVVFGTSSVWELCERKMAQVSQSIRHGRCGDTVQQVEERRESVSLQANHALWVGSDFPPL
jgi:hypothetical protein